MLRAILLIALLSLLFVAAPALAQTGAWISHAEDVPGSGVYRRACGETTILFTRERASQILFFDTNNGIWVEEDFDFRQEWVHWDAVGELAFAVSDTYVVAYNGLTSTAHSLRYSGERLRDDFNNWSYRCGDYLAYLATDEFLYVFDAEQDAWQELAIVPPGDYVNCYSNVGDDWVGISLERSYGNPADSYAYSLNANAFAQTNFGPPLGPTIGALNHGFAEYNNVSTDIEFVGYSSVTNTFAREALPPGTGPSHYDIGNHHGKDQRTVFAANYGVSGTGLWEHHMIAYDTRLGAWTHHTDLYDNLEHTTWTNVYVGGQYAVTVKQDRSTDELGFRVYSGINGSVTYYWPGVYYNSTIIVPGGTTFAVADQFGRAWGLDVTTGNNVLAGIPANRQWALRTEAENFSLFASYEYDSDFMQVYAYHGPSNVWYSINAWKNTSFDDTSGAHCYALMTTGTDLEAVFFSGILGTMRSIHFADTANPRWLHSDYLAYLLSDGGQGVLYDAHRDAQYERDLDWEYESLGEAVFVGADQGTQTAWGYSAVSGAWTSATVDDMIRVGEAGRYVAWVGDFWPTHRILAYNGFHDCWVELDTIGEADAIETGGQTILAYHMSTVWAFDPDAPMVGTEDHGDPEEPDTPGLPRALALHPVTPNPFNPSTTVAFELPRTGHVRLQAFDLRGRLVRTLTDEVWTAGTHDILWQGRDDAGHSLPSGTYFLRLETERKVVTQRAMLLK